MKILHSNEYDIIKFIYDNNLEITVKDVPSCLNLINKFTGIIETNLQESNVYSVFIPSSIGCSVGCKFCSLTTTGHSYNSIPINTLITNIKKSIIEAKKFNNQISDKNLQICWMGMGDPLCNIRIISEVTKEISLWAITEGYAKGISTVDISTSIPNSVENNWQKYLHDLNEYLNRFPKYIKSCNDSLSQADLLPIRRYQKKSRVRLFYTLISGNQKTRKGLMPNTIEINNALSALKLYTLGGRYDLIFHHLLLNEVNDTSSEVNELIALLKKFNLTNHELRVLRYNKPKNLVYNESEIFNESYNFDKIVNTFNRNLPFIKVQESLGTDILASIGQFSKFK